MINLNFHIPEKLNIIDETLKNIENDDILNRILNKDYTVWRNDPTEISNRLGWLDSVKNSSSAIPEISAFVEEIHNEGFTHALLLGMGGSSLAPEVFSITFGIKEGCLNL